MEFGRLDELFQNPEFTDGTTSETLRTKLVSIMRGSEMLTLLVFRALHSTAGQTEFSYQLNSTL